MQVTLYITASLATVAHALPLTFKHGVQEQHSNTVQARAAQATYDPAATLGPVTIPSVGEGDRIIDAVTSAVAQPFTSRQTAIAKKREEHDAAVAAATPTASPPTKHESAKLQALGKDNATQPFSDEDKKQIDTIFFHHLKSLMDFIGDKIASQHKAAMKALNKYTVDEQHPKKNGNKQKNHSPSTLDIMSKGIDIAVEAADAIYDTVEAHNPALKQWEKDLANKTDKLDLLGAGLDKEEHQTLETLYAKNPKAFLRVVGKIVLLERPVLAVLTKVNDGIEKQAGNDEAKARAMKEAFLRDMTLPAGM